MKDLNLDKPQTMIAMREFEKLLYKPASKVVNELPGFRTSDS